VVGVSNLSHIASIRHLPPAAFEGGGRKGKEKKELHIPNILIDFECYGFLFQYRNQQVHGVPRNYSKAA
jgi:hypothetical protein